MNENQVKALVVEDDGDEANMIQRLLADHGCGCDVARTLADGMARIETGEYNLCIVDVVLPSGGAMPAFADGMDIVRAARARKHDAKVMVLTGKADTSLEAAAGFAKGAHDYVFKSASEEEISARIGILVDSIRDFWRLMHPSWHDIIVDVANMHAYRLSDPAKTRLNLSKRHIDILVMFLRSPGVLISHERLANEGLGATRVDRSVMATLRQFIKHIRLVTGMDETKKFGICSVRGRGYALLG